MRDPRTIADGCGDQHERPTRRFMDDTQNIAASWKPVLAQKRQAQIRRGPRTIRRIRWFASRSSSIDLLHSVRGDTVPPIRGKVFRWRPKHPDREWRKLMPRNNMSNNARFAEIAALAGDPARVGMLHALMDGRALTASELARVASVTPQTASEHLAKMAAAGLVQVEKQGRHRYHRLASPAVAQMMESIMLVASRLALDSASTRRPLSVGPRDAAL